VGWVGRVSEMPKLQSATKDHQLQVGRLCQAVYSTQWIRIVAHCIYKWNRKPPEEYNSKYEQHHRWNRRCPYEPKGCQIEIQLPTEHCQRSTKLVISTGSTVILNKSTILWAKLKNLKKNDMWTLVKQRGKETVI